MNRERIAWVTSVVLIAILAFQLPGTLAHRDDDYAWVGQLVEIHRRVADSYVDPVDEEKLRQGAIDGMLGELDPFSVYVPPAKREDFDRMLEGSYKGVGIQLDQDEKTLEIQVLSPVEGSPAFKAGVLAGDVILKVNGEEVAGQKIEDVMKKITGPLGSEVTLTVRHLTGGQEDLTMQRQEIVMPTVKGFRRREDNTWDYFVSSEPKVAYVRVTQFTADTLDKMRGVLDGLLNDGMQGLILDLRFNPGGRLDQAEEVVDLFVTEGVIVMTKGRSRPEYVRRAKPEGTLPDFPMVVLINEHSASASEIVAGSLKDNGRALVVGERSYGKGSVQEVIELDGAGGRLKLTVAYYYLPSGQLVHRRKDATDWGVEPHVIVPMDPETERSIQRQQFESEYFRRPPVTQTKPGEDATGQDAPKDAAQPKTEGQNDAPGGAGAGGETKTGNEPGATPPAPGTEPAQPPVKAVDAQLEAAISTMIGHIILQGERARQVADGAAPAEDSPAPPRAGSAAESDPE